MDGVPPNVDWAKRAECNAAATRSSNTSLFYDFGLSGVSIVGHRGEDNYARRLRLRLINECTAQMARNEGGWAAFYWTNGAPLGTIVDCIGTDLVDANLSGIILLGDAIAFPDPVLHSFFTAWSSDSTLDRSEPISVASEVNSAYAIDVIGRFERSSGVRATLLCANDGNTRRVLLRRDGSRRILPFNFLVDEDPPVVQKDLSNTPAKEQSAKLSPDGKLLAFTSNESGHSEIYVTPFPHDGRRWKVSADGGQEAHWRRDGKEIFYIISLDYGLMALSVGGTSSLPAFGPPKLLFGGHYSEPTVVVWHAAPSAGGKQFMVLTGSINPPLAPLRLRQNWWAAAE